MNSHYQYVNLDSPPGTAAVELRGRRPHGDELLATEGDAGADVSTANQALSLVSHHAQLSAHLLVVPIRQLLTRAGQQLADAIGGTQLHAAGGRGDAVRAHIGPRQRNLRKDPLKVGPHDARPVDDSDGSGFSNVASRRLPQVARCAGQIARASRRGP